MRNLAEAITTAAAGSGRGTIRRGKIGRIVATPGEDRLYWVNDRPMPAGATGETANLSIGVEVFYWDDDNPVLLFGVVSD